jgi:arylsulfatase A-like enzyme
MVCARGRGCDVKVLLVVVDSLRGDAPSFAGGPVSTPTLDALARSGAACERAYCSGSWTIPSLVAMTTGLLPHRVGVCNWRHQLPAVSTLFSAFSQVGVEVCVFVPNPRYAFAGWPSVARIHDVQDREEVIRTLRAPGDRLVVVHHWSTHVPYVVERATWAGLKKGAHALVAALTADPERVAPKAEALYRRAVAHWSEEVLAAQLEAAGPDALVLVTADHGEQWGSSLPPGARIDHVFDLHGRWLDDATTRVPFVVAGPGVASARIEGIARGVDVAPTLCALAGVPWTGGDGIFAGTKPTVALTIRSHNTHEPEVYPRDGAKMWRAASLRTAEGRWTWDAVARAWESEPSDDARAVIEALLAEPLGPVLRPEFASAADPVRTRLGMLGYLE